MTKIAGAAMIMASIIIAIIVASPADKAVFGHIDIPDAGIFAEVYTDEHLQDCGCVPLMWNGGHVKTHADLSKICVGDMAVLISLHGDVLVLECVDIQRVWYGCGVEPNGDVLITNGRHICRFIRL